MTIGQDTHGRPGELGLPSYPTPQIAQIRVVPEPIRTNLGGDAHPTIGERRRAVAQQLFGIGVKELNKMQASNLIDDLLEKTGKKTSRRPRWQNHEGARR